METLIGQWTGFVDNTALNFHSFNKVEDFLTTQYSNTIFYLFYLKL